MHVVLVEQGPELLAPFHPRLRAYSHRELIDRGVDVRLNTAIREVGATSVTFDGGDVLPADLTVWAAGVTAPAAVGRWGLPQGRGGRILVGHDSASPVRSACSPPGTSPSWPTVAWLAWLGLHVVTLLGNRNRISTLLNLSWRYLAWPGGSGVIVGDAPE